MKLKEINPDNHTGIVVLNESSLTIGLELVPEAQPGDYLLVHAGMAIDILDDEDAEAILETIEEFVETADLTTPGDQS
jgi:hydrogenase expression/formation protein HypC